MKTNNLVCTVIVTWNNEKDIEICLESISNQSYPNNKIIVVDNNSSDQTCSIVEKFSEVILIKRDKNHFLTGSNNFGIKYCIKEFNPEYIMVLNADTKAESNLIEELVNAVNSNDRYGASGPKVKFFNNENDGLLNSTGLIYDGFKQAYDRGFKEEDLGQYDNTEVVFGVTGACILYKTAMLSDIGLYWNQIKMYLDEVEMFIRAKKAGWEVVYTPKTTLHHSYMKSTDKNKLFNAEKQKARAWLLIALKHYSLKSKLAMIGKYIDFRVSQVMDKDSAVV